MEYISVGFLIVTVFEIVATFRITDVAEFSYRYSYSGTNVAHE